MRLTPRAIMAAVAMLALPGAGRATTFVTVEYTCPVGGEKFEAQAVMSNITFGQRADGKPYSPLPIHPIPECPTNGLLLFDQEFSDPELAELASAIASDEYRAMRATETPHYRSWWLMKRIGRDPLAQLGALLQASWETDGDWERKVRYQVAFANEAAQLQRTDENATGWFWYTMRAANALRELGHYDKAVAMMDRAMAEGNLPAEPEAADNARFYAAALGALIAEENPVSEPANLVPPRIAAFRCVVPRSALTAAEKSACAGPEVRQAIGEFEAEDDDGRDLEGEAAIRYLDSRREPHR